MYIVLSVNITYISVVNHGKSYIAENSGIFKLLYATVLQPLFDNTLYYAYGRTITICSNFAML
jgi:hypothetical protein